MVDNFLISFFIYPACTHTWTETDLSVETGLACYFTFRITKRENFANNFKGLSQFTAIWIRSPSARATSYNNFWKLFICNGDIVVTLIIFFFGIINRLVFLDFVCF